MAEDLGVVAVVAHRFGDDGVIPNNPVLPLLVYPGVVDVAAGDAATRFEALFARNRWDRGWRNGIFPYPHYHSTAHEALGIACGRARVRFGGANGIELEVAAGDAVVLPAGVGHQNLGASRDLLVIGAYPPGPDWDLCRGAPDERPGVLANIEAVPLPPADPLYGADGPLLAHWRCPA